LRQVRSNKIFHDDNFPLPYSGLFIDHAGQSPPIYGEYFNIDYGRTLYLGETQDPIFKHLFVKGAGWNKGGIPFGEADWGMELHLGLIPLHEAAWREWVVSNYFNDNEFFTTRTIQISQLYELITADGSVIGAEAIAPRNGKPFQPANVFFACRCKYRMADLRFMTESQKWEFLEEAYRFFNVSSVEEYLDEIIERIVRNVARHHRNGNVVDTYSTQNLTGFGELTDFEEIYVKEYPFEIEAWNQNIEARQLKELYFVTESIAEIFQYLHIYTSYADIQTRVAQAYLINNDEPRFRKYFQGLRAI